MRVAAALSALFVLLAFGGMTPADLHNLGLWTLAALAIGVLGDILGIAVSRTKRRGIRPVRWPRSPQKRRVSRSKASKRPATIIMDGSNVMHWNGTPSQMVLQRVVQSLIDANQWPHIYFDANVGYKIADRFMNATEMAALLGLPANCVTVVDKGTPADPVLLDHARRANLRVVTNDRFLEWRTEFPGIEKRGFLVKGRWQQGTPQVRL